MYLWGNGFILALSKDPFMELEEGKLNYLQSQINLLIDNCLQLRKNFHEELKSVHRDFKQSAINLIDYLALRQFDIRELQDELSELGLSSLGRCEGHVMASLQTVLKVLYKLSNQTYPIPFQPPVLFGNDKKTLDQATGKLLGRKPEFREVRIMVTMPDEAAFNYHLVKEMIAGGMNVARVNCSHGEKENWHQMIQNIRKAAEEMQSPCKILMDLAGPKLRTGPISNHFPILKLSVKKNEEGKSIQNTLVLFCSLTNQPVSKEIPYLCMEENWLSKIEPGCEIYLKDHREKKRILKFASKDNKGYWFEVNKNTYVSKESRLVLHCKNKKYVTKTLLVSSPEQSLLLYSGDHLHLYKNGVEGENAKKNEKGEVISPAMISCQMPEIFSDAKTGETVRFDDGKIEGLIQKNDGQMMDILITRANEKGSKLGEEKGINFPETQINSAALTNKDMEDLDFVAAEADLIGFSFVHHQSDIHLLMQELQKRNASHLGIVLKIETQSAFQNLPWLLLTVMQHAKAGVMIARGDLAVETGWVRLAEVQEEILWLCEAAHIPVIWATQVLESLAKKGVPSRAEITDAAMSQRAECVMLNKGPHILKAIHILNEILSTMQAHQAKKTAKLRRLSVSDIKIPL